MESKVKYNRKATSVEAVQWNGDDDLLYNTPKRLAKKFVDVKQPI